MSYRLTTGQREKLKRLFLTYTPEKTWIFGDIPEKELNNAKKKYGQSMADHEEIILLHHYSTFGSNRGFILTTEALYTNCFNQHRPQVFSLTDINSITEKKPEGFLQRLDKLFDGDKVVIQLHSGSEFEANVFGNIAESPYKLLMTVWDELSGKASPQSKASTDSSNQGHCKNCNASNPPTHNYCEYCGSAI